MSYANLLGSLFIGTFFNTYLYGIVCIQYILFYEMSCPDSKKKRTVVAFIFMNDTFQSVAMIYMAWIYCANNFTNSNSVMFDIRWPYAYIPIGTALTTVATHLFMTHRIHNMSKNNFISFALVLTSLALLGIGIALGAEAWQLTDIREFVTLKTLVAGWLGTQVLLDVVIAALSIFLLHRQRVGSDRNTNGVIDRLIRTALQTGIAPLLFALAGLIAFIVLPNTNLFITFVIPIGRTYSACLLSALNVRKELHSRLVGLRDLEISANGAWQGHLQSPCGTAVHDNSTNSESLKTDRSLKLDDHKVMAKFDSQLPRAIVI